MDQQGSGRSRPAADARRQAVRPGSAGPAENAEDFTGPADEPGVGTGFWAGTGTGPVPGYGQLPVRGPGTGAPQGFGTGAHQAQGFGTGRRQAPRPGSGPQAVLGTPVEAQRGPGAQPGSGPQRTIGTGTGPQPLLGYGSGAQRVLGPGTGPQRLIGSGTGPHQVASTGSGAQPVPGLGAPPSRTPVRGFPPGRREPSSDSFTPRPFTGEDHAPEGGGPQPADTGAVAWDDADTMTWAQLPTPVEQPAGRRRGAKAKSERRFLSRPILVAAVAAVAVAAVGFGGYKFFYVPRVNAPVSSSLKLPTAATGSPGFDQSLGKWQHIGTRAEDPTPLNLEDLYPPQFELSGNSYVRTAASVTKSCSLAVYGANLQAALQTGKCTQVARATYMSGNGLMMGTIGVVNLSTSTLAQKAGKVTGPEEIIAPLAAQKGDTKKLGSGTGVEQAEIKGHYLILMWAEFTDLKSPSTSAARQQLENFADDLLVGSANINLSSRLLNSRS